MSVLKLLNRLRGRHAVVVLIVLLLVALVAIAAIPQRIALQTNVISDWGGSRLPLLRQLIDGMGLDHVVTTPWFLVIALSAVLALLFSLFDQIAVACRKTRSSPCLTNLLEVWGAPLLHLGLALVVLGSLVVVLTEQRAVFRLYEEETLQPGGVWLYEEHGPLTGSLVLPVTIRLDQVRPEYWEDGSLQQLTSYLTITKGTEVRHCRLAINQPEEADGNRIQQVEKYGKAFFLTVATKGAAPEAVAIMLAAPRSPGQESYGTFDVPSIPYPLQAKFRPWSPSETGPLNNRLTLRLEHDKGGMGQVALAVGDTGRLSQYEITVEHCANWAEFVVCRSSGIGVVFTGFFLIMLGSTLTYALSWSRIKRPDNEITTRNPC